MKISYKAVCNNFKKSCKEKCYLIILTALAICAVLVIVFVKQQIFSNVFGGYLIFYYIFISYKMSKSSHKDLNFFSLITYSILAFIFTWAGSVLIKNAYSDSIQTSLSLIFSTVILIVFYLLIIRSKGMKIWVGLVSISLYIYMMYVTSLSLMAYYVFKEYYLNNESSVRIITVLSYFYKFPDKSDYVLLTQFFVGKVLDILLLSHVIKWVLPSEKTDSLKKQL